MTIIKNMSNNYKCWCRHGKTGALIHYWWEGISTTIMESSMEIPLKTKNRTAI
jgi:hypothetical protein